MKKYKCAECGRISGEIHDCCCDIERCPKCKNQLLSCDCFELFGNYDEVIYDKDNKPYKRFRVGKSVDEDFDMGG